jgi:RNA polymerase sigma factor (sigma-70 family)
MAPTWSLFLGAFHFQCSAWPSAPDDDEQLLAVNEALEKLAAQDKLKAELVKLRYFAGLTIEEAAQVLRISEPTAKRYWTFAKAWLHREIETTAAR